MPVLRTSPPSRASRDKISTALCCLVRPPENISDLPQINFAEPVINHARHQPARGGDVENRLPPVGSLLAFHDAALEHHAEVLAEIHHGATGHIRALGDAHLAAIGQHLDNRPTELATQGEHRGHRIEFRQTGHGIHGRIFGCFWTGIAHFPAICRNSPRRQANCAKKLFRNTRWMTRSAKKKFRTTQRTSRSAKKRFSITPATGSCAKRKFRNRRATSRCAKKWFRISRRQRRSSRGNSPTAQWLDSLTWWNGLRRLRALHATKFTARSARQSTAAAGRSPCG